MVFKVYGGSTLLFGSAKLTGANATQRANVDPAGVTQLKLVVEDGGNGNAYDRADWADARFTFWGGPGAPSGRPRPPREVTLALPVRSVEQTSPVPALRC